MCRHCHEDGVVQVRWLTEEELEDEEGAVGCEWYEEPEVDESGDDEERIELDYCDREARLLVQMRVVDQHLCWRCARVLQEAAEKGLRAFLEGTGMQDDEGLLPFGEGERESCDECGEPASVAHRFHYTQCYCAKHAVASGAELPPRG